MSATNKKKKSSYPGLLSVGLVLCLAGAGGWAALHANHAGAAVKPSSATNSKEANPAPDPTQVLAAIPASSGNSMSDQAIAKSMRDAQKTPGNDRFWANLGDALMQKARETADVSYYSHAEQAYQKGLAVNAGSVDAINGMAWVCCGRHEFEKGIDWANKALAIDPKDNDAFGLIGDADLEIGDYNTAFDSYQKMLDIRPDIASYSRGAWILHLTGNNRKARWLMAKAINTGSIFAENTAWCRSRLGLMLLSDGNVLAADQLMSDAVQKNPRNYHVLFVTGKVKAAKKDYPAAISYYKQAIAVVPQHEALVALGDLYALQGNKAEAEKQYALVEAVHKLQKANGVLGDMLIAQFYADHDRNLPEALHIAQEEYKTRKSVYAADTLAWCYYKNGLYQEAQGMIANALKQQTPEALFLYHAGMIDAKLGNRVSATKLLYDALSLNPTFDPGAAQSASHTLKLLGSGEAGLRQVVAH